MRGTRWLLLAAILLILCGTTATYIYQQKVNKKTRIPPPAAIPNNTSGTAQDWEWSRTDQGRLVVNIKAHAFRQVADTGRIELEDIRLELYQRDKNLYDLVKSPKADFNQGEEKLFSNGEVEITLNIPVGQQPGPKQTSIKTSGVTFESKSGKASTDRPATFHFESGDGTSTGADYDPTTKELHMWKNVTLNMHSAGAKPMHVETPNLIYKEVGSVVWLTPTAKLVRGESVVDAAGAAIVNIKDGQVTSIDAQKAHGVNTYPKRKLDYYADSVHVDYNDQGTVTKMTGMGNARLNSVSDVSDTLLTADGLFMDFADQDGESVLTHTAGNGHAVVESKPLANPKKPKMAETRILRSNFVDVYMRAGGQEIERVQTQAPGVLEFLPNAPDEHRRLVNGDRMTITYAAKNVIQNFVSNNATTETFPSDAEHAKAVKDKKTTPLPSSKTASVNMTADFDAKGQLKTMKQWENFTYEEGDRRAHAVTAILENDKNLMDLQGGARIWEPTGSTDSDHIKIDQKAGNYEADGHVNTSRLPDAPKLASGRPDANPKAKNATPGLLDEDQPTQGTADRMTSANKNKLLHYEGNAVLWQEANRIQADHIDIDREKQVLKASGQVVTQLLDKPPAPETQKIGKDKAPPAPPPTPVFTIVKAPDLVYTDTDRLAHYTGGADLNRPGLEVRGREIRAFLKEQKKDDPAKPKAAADSDEEGGSRLDKAFADGDVIIDEKTLLHKRVGTGTHAEYYTDRDLVILRGNEAVLVDSAKGTSQGAELTYYTDNDKLIVSRTPQTQVKTKLKKSEKKKK